VSISNIFCAEMKESVWAICTADEASLAAIFRASSRSATRSLYSAGPYERRRGDGESIATATNERDFVTRFGTIRLRAAAYCRKKLSAPVGMCNRFRARRRMVPLLIREHFAAGFRHAAGGGGHPDPAKSERADRSGKLTRRSTAVRPVHQPS